MPTNTDTTDATTATPTEFNPFDPADPESRYAAMEQMRASCPVAPLGALNETGETDELGESGEPGETSEPGGKRWYAASHAAVLAGLKQVDKFVGSFIDTSKLPADEVMISAIPEPRHGKIRRVVNGVMAPHRTQHAEGFIRELAESLLDEVKAEGEAARADDSGAEGYTTTRFDLIDRYVDPIPSTVIAHVLGVPTADFQHFRRWSDELLENQNQQLADPAAPRTLSQSHPEFARYIQRHIDRRRAAPHPPDDLIGRFIGAEIDGRPLSDDMIRTQTMFLIIAGNETTRNWLGNYLTTLAADPELFAELKSGSGGAEEDGRDETDEPDKTDRLTPRERFMEESLRLESPVQMVARAAMEDLVLDGQPVARGDQVVFGIASANRDAAVFDQPAARNPARATLKQHLAFGAGPHICPGASLARLEARVTLDVFLERVRSVRLQPGVEFDYNPVFWALGMRSLPVEVEFE